MKRDKNIIDKTKIKTSKSFFKIILQKISLMAFVLICLFSIFIWQFNNSFSKNIKAKMLDMSYPILFSATSGIDSITDFFQYAKIFFSIKQENKKLQSEIKDLESKMSFMRIYEKENIELKKLLKFVKDSEYVFKSARVIGNSNSIFARSILIDAGLKDNVMVGQAVVNHQGVVGRVIETANHASRVLLITDFNSKIPVIGASSREHAILYGQNKEFLKLSFYEKHHDFEIGETLVTSGDGWLFPPGYPIAKIVDIEENKILAMPLIKWSLIDLVSVMQKPN